MIEKENVLSELARIVNNAGSIAKAAERLGVTAAYISNVLAGRQLPGKKLLDGMGYERLVVYLPKSDVQAWKDWVADKR